MREDVYRRLENLRAELGFTSINDLIVHLITVRDLVKELSRSTTGNPSTNPSNPKPLEVSKTTKVVCKPKYEVRNIEKYVKSLEGMDVLKDWWDEGEKYCFEIVEKKG